jgi:hypothetical protein
VITRQLPGTYTKEDANEIKLEEDKHQSVQPAHGSSGGVLVAAHELRDGQIERIRAFEAIATIDAVQGQRPKSGKTI